MKIDLHVHSQYSKDALSKPESIIREIKNKGLSGIAITDHNTVDAWSKLIPLAKKAGALVVKGEELKVQEQGQTIGELSALFLQEEITVIDFTEIVDEAKAQDALLIIQHPFDLFRHYWKRPEYWEKLSGIEAFNSRCILNSWNKKAMAFAREHNFPVTAGSDAHTPQEIGRAFVECDAQNEEELRKAIIKKEVHIAGKLSSPLIHAYSTIAKLNLMRPF
ncbi:MAG: histidinol-phosphatase [Candidatus Diapherotrites archaeon]|uniref:Histidinol-phosphatase n=1 Tax=Candidatus Iainarchaeum sp. TaxID=3101447 RepID=A0A2D6M1B7_9ARCH|nr:histidinol-phosphatase [Candidatus Diapherotrites archaeon]